MGLFKKKKRIVRYAKNPTSPQESHLEKEELAICPYCGKTLEQRPQRKKKCPFCANYIYVRTSPSTSKRILLTEEGTKQIELEWKKVNFRNNWLKNLEQYGISDNDFETQKVKLSKKFRQEASNHDVIWAIFNSLVTKNINDLSKLKMLYYDMALFLYEEGKDHLTVHQQSAKMELIRYKQMGVKNKDCSNILSKGNRGFCRCVFTPKV